MEASRPDSKTIEILRKLEGNQAFTTTAERYAKAIAESVMVNSKSKQALRTNFEDEMKKVVELKAGSYGIIYKGDIPLRIAPFIWSLDQQTRRTWAVFTFNNFYGHKNSMSPLKRITTAIVVTPYTASTDMVDDYGKGALAAFDEPTQFQKPLHTRETESIEKSRMDNKQFLNSALTLWMDLQQYTKAKLNMKLIYAVIIIAAILVAGYFLWPMLSKMIGGILPH